MVWKIIILSIAIVIASLVIAGTIVAVQILSGNVNIGDIGGQELGNSRQDPAPIINSNGTIVRIVDDAGSNSYSPNPVEAKVGETVTWVNKDSNLHTTKSRTAFSTRMSYSKGNRSPILLTKKASILTFATSTRAW